MAVARNILQGIVDHFAKEKKLKLGPKNTENLDLHRAFFVWRRADTLGTKYSNWVSEANQQTLKSRISLEFDEVEQYLKDKIGTPKSPGPLLPVLGGTGDANPPHLDLKDLAWQRTTETPTSTAVTTRAKDNTRLRRIRVLFIVWRAAGIHDELWAESADKKSAILTRTMANQLLDRRLRLIERMHFNIATPDEDPPTDFGAMGNRNWKGATGEWGPWPDKFRVRPFEYPRVPKHMASHIPAARIGEPGRQYVHPAHEGPGHVDQPTDFHWEWSQERGRLEWNIAPENALMGPGLHCWRLARSLRADWRPDQSDCTADPSVYCQFKINLVPTTGNGAQAIDKLFDYLTHSRSDFWERSWLWCDQVISACHLEALVFALRRHSLGEGAFNDLVQGVNLPAGAITPYVKICPAVSVGGAGAAGWLTFHANDPFFENRVIQDADLQIGDHLIFWNNAIYDLISTGDWRLENALVMNVVSTPDGKIDPKSIQLQGHGTEIRRYTAYQNMIAHKLRPAMELVRQKIAATPGALEIPWNRTRLVRWSPYDNLQRVEDPPGQVRNLGAWWVEVPLGSDTVPWTTVDAAIQNIPKAVGHLASPGPGYTPPPKQTGAVYFPIFEPGETLVVGGTTEVGWRAYIAKRGTVPKLRTLLRPVVMDGKVTPGLYRRGNNEISIVRPRPRP